MFKNDIKRLTTGINAMKTDLKTLENTAFYDGALQSLKDAEEELKTLKIKQDVVDKIKDLSVEEAEEYIQEAGVKLPKSFIQDMKRQEGLIKFKKELKNNGYKFKELKIQDRGDFKVAGYMIYDDDEFYCLSYNHVAIKATITDNIMSFIVNTDHEKYYSNNCLKVMKAFIIELFNLFELPTGKHFKIKEITTGYTINISCKYLTMWLNSNTINLNDKTINVKSYDIHITGINDDLLKVEY